MISLEEFPNGVKVYQAEGYKFTKDSIDLAKFCNIKHTDHVLELCAGSGVISFYAYALTKYTKLYLSEIQPMFCEAIKKNIELNDINAILFEGDLKNLQIDWFKKKLDVIICNPPYFANEANKNLEYSKAIARHEITITLKEIIFKASQLIKNKGRFYISMTAERTAELLSELSQKNFQAKRIKFLTNGKSEAYLVLVEAVYQGNIGTKIIIEK